MSEYSGKILVKILNDGKKDLAKAILECYKDVNVNVHDTEKTSLGNTPLHIASKNGHMDIVKALLKKGANVNARNKRENTPLHIASKIGYANIVDVMVNDYNANLNVQDNNGYTPLHYAVIGGYFKIVSTLVSKGANKKLGTYGKNGKTPLELANLNNKQGSHIKIVNLLEAKPVRDEKSHSGSKTRKKLGGGKQRRKKRATKSRKRYTGGVTLYLPPVNRIDNKGKTQLHYASEYGNMEVALAILNNGKEIVDVNIRDNDGFTPLHYAVKRGYNPIDNPTLGNIDMVSLLLANGAEVNVQDNDGYTPLHYAAHNANYDMVTLLLENGAKVTTLNRYNKTPIGYTSNKGIKEMLMKSLTDAEFIEYTEEYGQLVIDNSRDVYNKIVNERLSTNLFGVPTNTPLSGFN